MKPSDLNSLALWVEPERAMYDGATIGEIRNSGFVPCNWREATLQPGYETHSDLGHPGLEGTGATGQTLLATRMVDDVHDLDHAVHHGVSTIAAEWTVFIVVAQNPDSSPANWSTVLAHNWNSVNRLCVNVRHTTADPSACGISPYYNSTGILDTCPDDLLPHIYEFTYDYSDGTSWIDGAGGTTDAPTSTINYGAVDTTRLWKDKDAGREFDGTMGDLMYFNKVLDVHERGAVRGYLAAKYNIHVTA